MQLNILAVDNFLTSSRTVGFQVVRHFSTQLKEKVFKIFRRIVQRFLHESTKLKLFIQHEIFRVFHDYFFNSWKFNDVTKESRLFVRIYSRNLQQILEIRENLVSRSTVLPKSQNFVVAKMSWPNEVCKGRQNSNFKPLRTPFTVPQNVLDILCVKNIYYINFSEL